jgi:hypothetical protein
MPLEYASKSFKDDTISNLIWFWQYCKSRHSAQEKEVPGINQVFHWFLLQIIRLNWRSMRSIFCPRSLQLCGLGSSFQVRWRFILCSWVLASWLTSSEDVNELLNICATHKGICRYQNKNNIGWVSSSMFSLSFLSVANGEEDVSTISNSFPFKFNSSSWLQPPLWTSDLNLHVDARRGLKDTWLITTTGIHSYVVLPYT